MKKTLVALALAAVVLAAFLAGSWHGRTHSSTRSANASPRILHYVDPMNPAHTSSKPGLAPCGMKMEPVYEDAHSGPGASGRVLPPGAVQISDEKQQLIGVQTIVIEQKAHQRTLRLLGRIAADETRTYRINATVDGWITRALPYAAGSYVKKDQTLAEFYSPEFLSAGQALLFALSASDRVRGSGPENPAQQDQLAQFSINLRQYRDSLRNLGMGDRQIQEMIRTREFMENIALVSPADGFITARNLSEGQRFSKGDELYRITDLSRVWILADLFEKEARLVAPSSSVQFSFPGDSHSFSATLSDALPQFDGTSRTLKLRFEGDNPGFSLRPDMFVDVEVPVNLAEGIFVPEDAVLRTGTSQTVYVDLGNGSFEPRAIEPGWRLGGQVEVLKGLAAGEKIVVSGNFLLDSESRMRMAAAKSKEATALDPVCGMTVVPQKARAANLVIELDGQIHYFCNPSCKKAFTRDFKRVKHPHAISLPADDRGSLEPGEGA